MVQEDWTVSRLLHSGSLLLEDAPTPTRRLLNCFGPRLTTACQSPPAKNACNSCMNWATANPASSGTLCPRRRMPCLRAAASPASCDQTPTNLTSTARCRMVPVSRPLRKPQRTGNRSTARNSFHRVWSGEQRLCTERMWRTMCAKT